MTPPPTASRSRIRKVRPFTFGGLVTILNDAAAPTATASTCRPTTPPTARSTSTAASTSPSTAPARSASARRSSGTVNILDPNGTNQITSNNGTAILINPTTLNATLNSVTSAGGSEGISLNGMSGSLTIGSVDLDGQTGDGIDITNSAGSVTINGGSSATTNDPGGIGVDINGGTGNVTISATINKTTAGDVVEVTGRSTGTVDFNGNITSSGAGGGIDINTNTGGTVRFDGGMNLSTGATTAFNSTGNTGMTLVVTDHGVDQQHPDHHHRHRAQRRQHDHRRRGPDVPEHLVERPAARPASS